MNQPQPTRTGTRVFDQQAQCGRKRTYKRRSEAKKALRQQQSQSNGSPLLDVYECPWCGLWHIGRNPEKRTNPPRRNP